LTRSGDTGNSGVPGEVGNLNIGSIMICVERLTVFPRSDIRMVDELLPHGKARINTPFATATSAKELR